ncbi:MAG: TraB/GumN family protein [Leptonema sp. (in: bacteria)]
MFNKKLKNTQGPYEIVTIKKNKKKFIILLLGTAHISKESIMDVEVSIQQFGPDIICVELCKSRFESILNPDKWKNLDIVKVIKEKKIALLASNLILSSFQKKIGLDIGIQPGSEMIKAIELAKEKNIKIRYIDREIRTTLLRTWRNISFFDKIWLVNYLIATLLISEKITEQEIEKLKQKDVLEDLFENIPLRYQKIKQILIEERDQYMAESIRQILEENYKKNIIKIFVVIGAGHLKGISNYLKENFQFSIEHLNSIPQSKPIRTILTWIGITLLIAFFTLLFLKEKQSAKELILVWAISRSLGAGLGALLALAHPITILITMMLAPFSVFIPGTRLWMFSALSEVIIHKPRVKDFESIAEDTKNFKSFLKSLYRNRVLKLFWIISLVSTGLTIGNLTFLQKLIEKILNFF